MQSQKKSLATVQHKMNRKEMKSIMAGAGSVGNCPLSCGSIDCSSGNNCKCFNQGTASEYCGKR